MMTANEYKNGDRAVVRNCSRVEQGSEVVILGYSKSMREYWCQSAMGRTCFWVKAGELSRRESNGKM